MSVFANFVSYFANNGETADELQARSDAADSKLAAMNAEKHASGDPRYDDDWYDQTQIHLATQRAQSADIGGQIDSEGLAGFKDGLNNDKKAVGFGLGLVPWYVWIIGLAILFLYIGAPLPKRRP